MNVEPSEAVCTVRDPRTNEVLKYCPHHHPVEYAREQARHRGSE